MLYDWEIVSLSNDFYEVYSNNDFKEMLKPSGDRKYCLILYDSVKDYFVAVPFRSNMSHNNGFYFQNSERSRLKRSGLDYSKSVIIADDKYIGKHSRIDDDEFNEFLTNLPTIHYEIFDYIETYKQIVSGNMEMSTEEYRRTYGYSSLKYFHEELELEKTEQCEEQE